VWIIIAGISLFVIQVVLVVAWWKLPAWAPVWTAQYSLWPEPALRAMRSGQPEVADIVERRLLEWGPSIASTLRRAFDHGGAELRARVMQLASTLARQEGIQPGTRFAAGDPFALTDSQVATMREELVQLALAALRDGSGFLPMNAAYLLMPLNDSRAVEPFARFIMGKPTPLDEDLVPLVRLLGSLRDPRAVPALISVLPIRHKPHPAVEEALEQCTTAEAVPAVIVATTHTHAVVRQWAAQQHARLPRSPTFDARLVALIGDAERQVCLSAITAAVTAKVLTAVPALMTVAQSRDDHATQLAAITALGELGDAQADGVLTTLAGDAEHDVAQRARAALDRLAATPAQRQRVIAP
jgi:HEAT repeat protein